MTRPEAGDWRHILPAEASSRPGRSAREYLLHVPPDYDPARPAPLVLALHGGGGTAEITARATHWSERADREGFIVAYPEATRPDPARPASFLRNPQFWNTEIGFGDPSTSAVDDVAFLDALLDEIGAGFAIDPRRVHVTGFSNGGSMALLLASRRANRFAAVGVVAGKLWHRATPPEHPLPLIYITGDRDPLNPLEGGTVQSPWGRDLEQPPVREWIDTWAAWLDCPATPGIEPDAPQGVRLERYAPGRDGSELEFLTLSGGGHVWPGGTRVLAERLTGPDVGRLDATATIWSFFARHPRPNAP